MKIQMKSLFNQCGYIKIRIFWVRVYFFVNSCLLEYEECALVRWRSVQIG